MPFNIFRKDPWCRHLQAAATDSPICTNMILNTCLVFLLFLFTCWFGCRRTVLFLISWASEWICYIFYLVLMELLSATVLEIQISSPIKLILTSDLCTFPWLLNPNLALRLGMPWYILKTEKLTVGSGVKLLVNSIYLFRYLFAYGDELLNYRFTLPS